MITKPSIVLKLPFLWPLLPCSPETPWLAEECHPRRQRGPGFLLENPLVSPKTCHVKWEKMEKNAWWHGGINTPKHWWRRYDEDIADMMRM
jgi:hypothetical protein